MSTGVRGPPLHVAAGGGGGGVSHQGRQVSAKVRGPPLHVAARGVHTKVVRCMWQPGGSHQDRQVSAGVRDEWGGGGGGVTPRSSGECWG